VAEESDSVELAAALRARLDLDELHVLIEFVAERLGCDNGVWTLEFICEGGSLRCSHLKRGPVARPTSCRSPPPRCSR